MSVLMRLTASTVASHVSARKAAATIRKRTPPSRPHCTSKNRLCTTASSYFAGRSPCGWSRAKASRQVISVVTMLPPTPKALSASRNRRHGRQRSRRSPALSGTNPLSGISSCSNGL
jgi:hypothetical protein